MKLTYQDKWFIGGVAMLCITLLTIAVSLVYLAHHL